MHYTPTEKKILYHLRDGMRHKRDEVIGECLDEMATRRNLSPMLTYLRKKLRPQGEDIICELYNGGIYYRYVRLISHEE